MKHKIKNMRPHDEDSVRKRTTKHWVITTINCLYPFLFDLVNYLSPNYKENINKILEYWCLNIKKCHELEW